MTPRTAVRFTLLAAAVLLATACNRTSDEGATASPEATAASEAATPSPAASEAASAASPETASPAASEPADTAHANIPPPQGFPPGPTPVEGTDYTLIDTPAQPSGDKVQVVEVFGYGCPHCNALQPHLSEWEKTVPSDVNFQYMPAAFGSDPAHCWDDFARGFYTAQAMGFLAKNHDAIYKAVWDENRPNTGCAAIPGLFAKFGSDEKTISATMQSFAIGTKVSAAHEQAIRWGVDSTPSIIVDGKFKVIELTASGPKGMLHTVDWLIAKQRPEHAKH